MANKEKKYKKIMELGEGAFGAVHKVKSLVDGKEYARKRIKADLEREGMPPTIMREITILKYLDHPNIIKLRDVIYNPNPELNLKFDLIFDLEDQDLAKYTKKYQSSGKLSNQQIKIVHGMDYCHRRRLIHRDLKPYNILVSNQGIVKIADFGLVRPLLLLDTHFTVGCGTTCYQAPEMLFGANRYSFPVDVWAIGCIFGYLVLGTTLFNGDSSLDIIFEIFSILGGPDERFRKALLDKNQYKYFPKNFGRFPRNTNKEKFHEIKQVLQKDGYDLFSQMLKVNPDDRISCKKALQHKYFDGIKEQFHIY